MPNPRGRPKKEKISKAADNIAKSEQMAEILSMRLQGFSLTAIGKQQNLSGDRIRQLIEKALASNVEDNLENVRELELNRLDELLTGVYEKAVNGDLFNLDRVLSIMNQRSRLQGLNKAPANVFTTVNASGEEISETASLLKIVIVGDPEATRKQTKPQDQLMVEQSVGKTSEALGKESQGDLSD